MSTKKTTIKSYLPAFSGFYGSYYESNDESFVDSEVDYINEERAKHKLSELPAGVISEVLYNAIDYSAYYKKCAELIHTEVESRLINKGYILGSKFDNLYSPKEYNFHNDSINCTFELGLVQKNKITKDILNNLDSFKKYLENHFKSRSGFISFYPYEVENWISGKKLNIECFENAVRFNALLDFLLLLDGEEIESYIYENVNGNIYMSEFIEPGIYNKLTEQEYCNNCGKFKNECICKELKVKKAIEEKYKYNDKPIILFLSQKDKSNESKTSNNINNQNTLNSSNIK